MSKYILKRIGQSLAVLFLVSVFAFILLYMVPGDPVCAMLGGDITREQYDIAYREMGLDRSVMVRYFGWLFRFVTGDWGKSFKYAMPVVEVIGSRLPVTMFLGLISVVIGTGFGILLGTVAGKNRGKLSDSFITVCSNLGAVMPVFWLAVLGMYIFSLKLGWLPSHGFSFASEPWLMVRQAVLPVISLSVGQICITTRQMRSGMLEVIRQDYIRTARAKGLKESQVVYRHAIRNAVLPVVTLTGMSIRNVVAGAVSIEQVFAIAGMGSLLMNGILSKDVAVVQACIMIIAIVVVLSTLIVDISYGILDPRIRIK